MMGKWELSHFIFSSLFKIRYHKDMLISAIKYCKLRYIFVRGIVRACYLHNLGTHRLPSDSDIISYKLGKKNVSVLNAFI